MKYFILITFLVVISNSFFSQSMNFENKILQGDSLLKKGKYLSATKIYKDALTELELDYLENRIITLYKIGNSLQNYRDLDSALFYYNIGNGLVKRSNSPISLMYCQYYNGCYYLTTGEIDKAGKSAIILCLFDTSSNLEQVKQEFDSLKSQLFDERIEIIWVANKIDLVTDVDSKLKGIECIKISASEGENIKELISEIIKITNSKQSQEQEVVVTNVRYYEALTKANEAILQVTNALNMGIPGDLVARTNYIELEQLDWADYIYVMEIKHSKFVNQFSERKFRNKIEILHIKDIYTYNQKELITLSLDKFDFEN